MKTKTVYLVCLACSLALAPFIIGQSPAPRGAIVTAATQPAGALTIPITSDEATILETARTNAPFIDAAGKPMYASVAAFVAAQPAWKQMLRGFAARYPTPALKAALDTARAGAAKAQADAQAAVVAVIP